MFCFECGPVATNCYLVGDASTLTAYLVDAPYGAHEPVMRTLREQGWRLTDILLTHTHWDHTADCARIKRDTGAAVTVHESDLYRLIDPMAHTIWPLPFTIDAVLDALTIDGSVEHVTLMSGLRLKVLHTPGHTEGGICFVDEANERVFVGDTLFHQSVGRTDLPGGDMETLIESIRRELFVLPDSYVAWPGHGPKTTIGLERTSNPFAGEVLW
ncbi:MAG: MBL fold metallo-hydrolase [Candidatus Kapabacteria bacterium]|nr:MBL fold metallo-hydrolase [Candidatus Kapabacteria bacterium]